MPVVVTGADTPIGELVIASLVGQGIDLRATVDDRALVADLVAQGVKTAVSDLVDTERFGAVLEDAHTVIHLRGSAVGAHAVLDGVEDVLAAAPDSGLERIVTIAALSGDAVTHPALQVLDACDYTTVVLHVGVVLAPLSDPRAEVPAFDDPDLLMAPLWAADLVAALVAADRLRDLRGHLHVDAVGPDVVTAADLLTRLGVAVPDEEAPPAPYSLVGDRGAALRDVLGVHPRSLDEAVGLALAGL